ncbi:amino acid transporter [Lapidilactobacillus concavus DSM 17758]|uniref:Amino acid transporter n=2 Tax=Lapidilactobacillus TaxID=2767884 RepID=A0A0R1VTT4_9LACO|nr:amino acid transporter [Lapidilactobacillus concavus DSM 17758]GEL13449.1 amino acid permease [Lapidilactobacillus concavus]
MTDNNELKRAMGLTSTLTTVMGTVIGGGVFFKISTLASATRSPNVLLMVWLLAGFLTITGGLCLAEISTAIPEAGGAVNYIELAYGKLPSFLLGWAQILIYYPANIAALSIVFATQLVSLAAWPVIWIIPLAFLTAGSLTALNLLGARFGSFVQSLTLFLKIIPIAIIIVFGVLNPHAQPLQLWPIQPVQHVSWLTALNGGLLATMFAYDGWISVGNMAGEMKNPRKHLPIAIIGGLGLTTLVYFLINLAFLKALPISHLMNNPTAAADSAMAIFGGFGGRLVTVGILVSVYGAINGYTMTGMRVAYAMGVNRTIPLSKYFRQVTSATQVPWLSGVVQLLIAGVMMLLGNFDKLTDMLVFVMWIFNTMIFGAVFILRRKQPDLKRPYQVKGYPYIPIIAMLGGAFIVVSTLITQFQLATLGIIITLIGVPVFYWQQKHQDQD